MSQKYCHYIKRETESKKAHEVNPRISEAKQSIITNSLTSLSSLAKD
ncbi:hypothetical protein Plhal304r1_c029g0095581 [Plasmopara halstedii]